MAKRIYIYMYGTPYTCMRGSETESKNEVSMAFCTEDKIRCFGTLRGRKVIHRTIRKTDVQQLDVCPVLQMSRTKLFLVTTLIMGKTPVRILSGREKTFLWSQSLNCLQLKIIHVPKWHILGRPPLNPFGGNIFSMSLRDVQRFHRLAPSWAVHVAQVLI